MAKKIICLGTAHLSSTPGKCSPNGKFKEAFYSREQVKSLKAALEGSGYTVYIDYEPLEPLPEWTVARKKLGWNKGEQSKELCYRVNRVNALCNQYGKNNVCYISIHNNAAGNDGQWKKAGGLAVYTSKGQTKGDVLAECIYESAEKNLVEYKHMFPELKKRGDYDQRQIPIRRDKTDGDSDYEENFYVLKNTNCPACLVEILFQDNKADVAYMESATGFLEIHRMLFEGIVSFCNKG